ncbi:patatin-like phospholipase family protein [Moraxella marmotae]|uniref:patatin-like phospholipase family protein n=1 Tax=Moraxella marmotae TaxID=3344520 RepID=UPI0035F43574
MNNQIGLVLSGGGAKGAYHVGVMQAIKELGLSIGMISGASIGALNGAVLASAPSLDIGTERLTELWWSLTKENPIEPNELKEFIQVASKTWGLGTYIKLLTSAGLQLNPLALALILMFGVHETPTLCSDRVLRKQMAKYLDMERLQQSIPLYVSVFPQKTHNSLGDVAIGIKDLIQTTLFSQENCLSEFRHIQSLSLDDQKEMILASAALPLLFQARKQNGIRYTDGGQGGMVKSQGNTPITPLIDAGCRHVIVVHLDGGSLWHRYDHGDDISIVEIRPSIDMGGFFAMLDFSEETVAKLIKTGYQDAMHALGRVQSALSAVYAARHQTQLMMQAITSYDSNQTQLDHTSEARSPTTKYEGRQKLDNAMAELAKMFE